MDQNHTDQDHHERIRQRAHEIWESEGRPQGRDAEHWTRAEEELRNRMGGDRQDEGDSQPQLAQTTPAPKPKRKAAPRKSAKKAADSGTSVDGGSMGSEGP